jgi:hypothetical protein
MKTIGVLLFVLFTLATGFTLRSLSPAAAAQKPLTSLRPAGSGAPRKMTSRRSSDR